MTSNTSAPAMDDFTPRDSMENQPTIEQLVDRQLEEFKAALANRVAAQFEHQERLLEEARRDLALHKEALSNSERAKQDLEEKFERERQALNDEIRQLKRVTHAYEERFGQATKALNDFFELKTIANPKNRVECQKNPPSTLADAEQHAMMGEGILAT